MARPQTISIRSYQVGFGDCFLLGFHYKTTSRHVLIDFGSTARPRGAGANHMVRIAEDIKETCSGTLHAVVATHRHKDHISGFATENDARGSGDIIASLKPDVVIQPWTEDPNAKPDAPGPTQVSQAARAMVGMLDDIHRVAEAAAREIQAWPATSRLRAQLSFLGETNLSSRSAVENLMKMGLHRRYVHFGSSSGLVLPGVKVRVLGPPTLEQSLTIKKQRRTDEDEFWHLQALASDFAVGSGRSFFSKQYGASEPPSSARWLLDRMKTLRRRELREIVRILDRVLNNTSVILLFEAGKQKLLFPGDAQIENWSYALSKPAIRKLLRNVTVYKVGHHGSLNATPKTLWNNFARKDTKQAPTRLETFVSTMAGKHGSTRRETEVPRRPLVRALERQSNYHTTQDVGVRDLFAEVTVEV